MMSSPVSQGNHNQDMVKTTLEKGDNRCVDRLVVDDKMITCPLDHN